jgi:glycosyltransferase involved in cell wall biosynthesis
MFTCPIVINNRNRLTTTKNMVEHLLQLNPTQKIIILDNDSTYIPLLQWYKTMFGKIEIMMLANEGHLAFWLIGLDKTIGKYFVYTDSDIILNKNLGALFLEMMYDYHIIYDVDKIAFGLKIDDIPDHYRYKQQVLRNEGRWWLEENKVEKNIYRADTDTTFALYKNNYDNQYNSLRLTHDFLIAQHAPWYDDIYNLSDEEKYYLDNLGDRQLTQYSKQAKYPEQYSNI